MALNQITIGKLIPRTASFKRVEPAWAASALILLLTGTFAGSEIFPGYCVRVRAHWRKPGFSSS